MVVAYIWLAGLTIYVLWQAKVSNANFQSIERTLSSSTRTFRAINESIAKLQQRR
jgi:cell division protein FtsL